MHCLSIHSLQVLSDTHGQHGMVPVSLDSVKPLLIVQNAAADHRITCFPFLHHLTFRVASRTMENADSIGLVLDTGSLSSADRVRRITRNQWIRPGKPERKRLRLGSPLQLTGKCALI